MEEEKTNALEVATQENEEREKKKNEKVEQKGLNTVSISLSPRESSVIVSKILIFWKYLIK